MSYYGKIAFGEAAKALQEEAGSRAAYARQERENKKEGINTYEASFIAQRDSFYMASITESGFPYIQHRGGPKGFLKVLDEKRLGFIDFGGNKQYVSVGNFETNQNVSLFLMDYAHKIRLKIFARAEVVELDGNEELYESLDLKDYKFRAERMIVFHVVSFDWNCPQHITPRYTAGEVEAVIKPQLEYIAQLEAEIEQLKAQININNA
ncbi:pyridoxamine 5'-phosphate oxidase family protein [Emticicia sp. BO119]|uniref:pyridoxamine 5'-phosphate oxidase family protein n=1 Tax=Emticicia sp. BO119 TaxID=2757768 RepID=UPI0015EFE1AA|nr:pyridoxamine 5'-phosphate oxidase family protein [Emticicia sp. BO119]MBA4852173.1 pyridoxamine 5'-phosphate oxidase family protein [Emticicia sp. BO119]